MIFAFRELDQARNIQVMAAIDAAICVLTNAAVATRPIDKALPPLNPNHPNQSNAVPRTVSVTL